MARPTKAAYEAALGILSYLNKTKEYGITYRHGGPRTMEVYCDASFGRDLRPMAGHFIYMAGAPISWQSKSLKVIPQSSCEAEVAAASNACKDLAFLRNCLVDLREPVRLPVVVYTDNKACRDLADKQGVSARTKHFNRWLYYIREMRVDGLIRIGLITTQMQIADCLTKCLPKTAFLNMRQRLLS